jgi:MoxR-like ATPase
MSNTPTTFDPWDVLQHLLDAGAPRLLVYGPPGTGKSLTPCLWARDRGWELLSVTLTEETPMTELRGHFVLKGNAFVWHDGLIARAWRVSHTHPRGVVVVLNEIDHAGGDLRSFLPRPSMIPRWRASFCRMARPCPASGKILRHATMNGRPEDLPEALRDRLPVVLAMDRPHPKAIEGLPPDLQALAANSPTARDEDRRVTPRALYAFATLREQLGAPMAAFAIFGQAGPDLLNALALADRR